MPAVFAAEDDVSSRMTFLMIEWPTCERIGMPPAFSINSGTLRLQIKL